MGVEFIMTSDNNIRLLYELNGRDAQLDFAIQQVERQLASVNRKLKSLWHDLAFYVAMLILPVLIIQLCNNLYTVSLVLPFLVLFQSGLRGVYLIFLPFVIYHLGQTVYLLKINRENTEEYPEPPRAGTLRGERPNREPTYRIEQKKLIYILSRYYLNKDTMNQIRRRITESEDSDTMTMMELKYQLNNLPFYEDVRPADPFAGKTGNIVLLMSISFILNLIYTLRVWMVI